MVNNLQPFFVSVFCPPSRQKIIKLAKPKGHDNCNGNNTKPLAFQVSNQLFQPITLGVSQKTTALFTVAKHVVSSLSWQYLKKKYQILMHNQHKHDFHSTLNCTRFCSRIEQRNISLQDILKDRSQHKAVSHGRLVAFTQQHSDHASLARVYL